MGKYSCEKCAKSFSQKSHYDKHISRKNPCEIQTDKIKSLIDKAVDEKLIELNIKLKLNNTESNITINMTEQMDILKMSKIDLLEKCKELGITKCSSKNKPQLIELINSKQQIPNCKLKTEVEETNNIICNSQNIIISTDNTSSADTIKPNDNSFKFTIDSKLTNKSNFIFNQYSSNIGIPTTSSFFSSTINPEISAYIVPSDSPASFQTQKAVGTQAAYFGNGNISTVKLDSNNNYITGTFHFRLL